MKPLLLFSLTYLGFQSSAQVSVIGSQKYSDTQGGVPIQLYNEDRFGEVASIGDLNNDGVTDLACGAYWRDDEEGVMGIFFMNSDGTIQSVQIIANNTGGLGNVLMPDVNFGSVIKVIGDLNNDGVNDLAVSGHDAGYAAPLAGAIFILLMNTDGTINSYYIIDGTNPNFNGVLDASDGLGGSIGALGDFDGDGVEDIVTGAYADDDGGFDEGAIYLIMLNTDGSVKSYYKLYDGNGSLPFSLDDQDHFSVPECVGDINGDGVVDIIVGSNGDDDGGTDKGAVYLLFLNANGTVSDYIKYSDVPGVNQVSLSNGDQFGKYLEAADDLDGDGINDLLISSYFDDYTGTDAGAAWILFPDSDGNLISTQRITEGLSGFMEDIDSYDWFGSRVTSIGDFNNDGFNDMAAGAIRDDDGGTDRGAFYIIYLYNELPSVFASSDTTLCEKFCIDYFDLSPGNPVAWQWTFEGADPITSIDQNPVNICYDNPGVFDVTSITTTSSGTSDTLLLTDFITVYTNPFAPVVTQYGNTLTSSPADSYQWLLNGIEIPGATSQSYDITQSGLYTVVIMDQNGCTAQSDIKATLVGINDPVSDLQLNILFSNPAEDFVILDGTIEGSQYAHLRLFNITGQSVWEDNVLLSNQFRTEINLSRFTGMYFLEIRCESGKIVSKIVTQ